VLLRNYVVEQEMYDEDKKNKGGWKRREPKTIHRYLD
jgi:hypothetical protein